MKHDSVINILREHFAAAIAEVAGTSAAGDDAMVRAAGDPKFGDYQCNVAMSLARPLKAKPREIAERIVAAVQPALADISEPLEIAGPGFINIRLKDEFLAQYLGEIPAPEPRAEATGPSDRLGLPPVENPRKVVIDYSSPNIAKQMHVGHLRSTIIGDVFARVLGFLGHNVVRQNHVGDWGTQFGRVILGLWQICMAHKRGQPEYTKQTAAALPEDPQDPSSIAVFQTFRELFNADYREDDLHTKPDDTPDGKKHFLPFLQRIGKSHDVSLEQLEEAYILVDKLSAIAKAHGNDPYAGLPQDVTRMLQLKEEQEHLAWQYAKDITLEHCDEVYSRLNVLLGREDVRGESFYNDQLGPTVTELRERLRPGASERGEFREDQGAQCVYLYDEKGEAAFRKRDGEPLPMIVQKSDGAYNYDTTDLAAIRYRVDELGAQRLIYVTDARQKLHFQMLFAAAGAAGWTTDDVTLEHVYFGSILGDNRRPLKTREGETVKLRDLLDEAERRALALLEERGRGGEGPRGQGAEGSRDRGAEPEAQARVSASNDQEPASTFTDDEKRDIARRVGIAAVKYADLRGDRTSDYLFGWDKMLAMQGNTAPYMMYAYARIRSIYRKAAEHFGSPDVYAPSVSLTLSGPEERALALRLTRLRETIDAVAADLEPHTLCNYLYDVASDFMRFYEACPVVRASDEPTRLSRMRLCDLTARTLKLGLGLLGISVIERM